MKTLIVGCGYVGIALGKALVARGDEVTGLCRSTESVAALKETGIQPVVADITAPDSLRDLKPAFDFVVNCVSSGRRGVDAYREVYVEGTTHLLEWMKQAPPKLLLFTGSTTVFAQTEGEWVDESSPTEPPHESGKILLDTERLLIESRLPVVILRLAGIYGPGRHAMLDKLRARASVLPGDGRHYINMIHRDDIVQVILAAMDHRPAGEIINVADDEPTSQSDYVRWLCERLACPMVKFDPNAETRFKTAMRKGFQPNRRVCNAKMKSMLGVALRFPSFREGLKEIFSEETR